MTIIDQALQVAQEQSLKVFPVASDKRPLIKGWREKATDDPDEIKELFSLPGAAGIGVPCGPDEDIICFDLDFGHTDDPDRLQKLNDWLEQWKDDIDENAMVRRTRSGGLHVLYLWPHSHEGRPPRRIMPKLDVIIEGFYFVWAMDDGSYTHMQGEMAGEPPEGMCDVVERDTLGAGGALMPPEDAHDAMWSDGDAGTRHDALLRMTQDWATDHPEDDIATWCSEFESWFRDIYEGRIDRNRVNVMLEWNVEDERGELYRAFRGVRMTEQRADALLAKAGEKLRAEGRMPTLPPAQHEKLRPTPEEAKVQMISEFAEIDLNKLIGTELEDIDWIVDDLLPAGNLISLTGPSGAGKTRFNALLMAAMSSGNTDKIGLPKAARPINTLYIANEERTADVERRLKAAAVLNDLKGDMKIVVRGKEHGRFHLIGSDGNVVQEMVDALIDVVKAQDIELLMIDPIVTVGIEDENSAAQVDVAMGALQNIAAATGCCVMFVHHSPKDRTAPEDQFRGDSSAWRGSGVFYSSLDLGLTLMPWLPDECHDRQTGKETRRRWRNMIRNHRAPRYVVLDSAKERENEGLASTLFEIVGQEVRVGGRKIGAMRHVSLKEAQLNATALLAGPDVDDAAAHQWASAMLSHKDWGQPGRHDVTLRQIAEHFDKEKPAGWPADRNKDEKLRTDRGNGRRIIDTLGRTQVVQKNTVYLLFEEGVSVWQVSGI